MIRVLSIVAITARIARADDMVALDAEVNASILLPRAGASIVYSNRFGDDAITLRAGAGVGERFLIEEDRDFTYVEALVGYRRYWSEAFFEASAGWLGMRHAGHLLSDGVDGDSYVSTFWLNDPVIQLGIGAQYDALDVGVTFDVLSVGIGLRAGVVL